MEQGIILTQEFFTVQGILPEQWILIGMLGLYAGEDIRKRHISVPLLILFGLIGTGLQIWRGDSSAVDVLLGVTVGGVLVLLGFLTRESIGLGDGYLFVVTGIFLGGAANVELLFISLLYAALFSLGVLIFRKGKRNQEIPFIPFVFLGYLTIIVGGSL